MSQDKNTNQEDYLVPSFRNNDDPFYIIPEYETDSIIYWQGYDEEIKDNVYYSCKKDNAIPVIHGEENV